MEWKRRNKGLLKPVILEFLELWALQWIDVLQGRTFQDTQVCAISLRLTQALHFWSTRIWRPSPKFASRQWFSAQCQSQFHPVRRTDSEQIQPLHSKGSKTKWGFQQERFLGHLAVMNWSGSMSIFVSTKEGPLGNTKQCCFSPWNACSDYDIPIASSASQWKMRDIFTELLLETKPQSVFTSCGRRAIMTQGQSAASSWAYISKASLTTKGNWYPSA